MGDQVPAQDADRHQSFSTRTTIITHLTGDKTKLLAGVKKMKWPMGATYTHKALLQAQNMLKFSGISRIKSILLLTDGAATDRRGVFTVSRNVRNQGITIKIVPVGRGIS